MKTVVITGSTRGLGFEMAKCFKASGWNVVINGVDSERLKAAIHRIVSLTGCRDVYGILTNGGFSGNNRRSDEKDRKAEGHGVQRIDKFVGNAEQFDDLTMVCLEYRGTKE